MKQHLIIILYITAVMNPQALVHTHSISSVIEHAPNNAILLEAKPFNHLLKINQDFGINSTEISDPIIQAISDIFWLIINELISYIPYFGSNGSNFIDIFFYGSIFGGMVITIKVIRNT